MYAFRVTDREQNVEVRIKKEQKHSPASMQCRAIIDPPGKHQMAFCWPADDGPF